MALVPLDRPPGSSHFLHYRGTVISSGEAAATYPKEAGEFPSDSTVTGTYFDAYVRFPLYDETDVEDTAKRFPPHVFDNSQPASSSPHGTAASGASATPGVNVTDLAMVQQTWAQNVEIRVHEIPTATALVISCDTAIANNLDPASGAMIVIDQGADSGMGTDTGLPVAILHFRVLADDGAVQSFNVDVSFEIKHSATR